MTERIFMYSHGFGATENDRGLFTEIADLFPEFIHVMFNYNQIDKATATITVAPLNEQARQLQAVYRETREAHPNARIDLICHSQGCLVAAIAALNDIQTTLFLTPPDSISIAGMKETFDRPDHTIDITTDSTIARSDGSYTIIPKEYWIGLDDILVLSLYEQLAKHTKLTILQAADDEVLGATDFSQTSDNITLSQVASDHNFTGETRALLQMIAIELLS